MIRGYFRVAGGTRRAYVNGLVEFADRQGPVSVQFLIDTGADRTVLSARVLADAGITLADQPLGLPASGVGGAVYRRAIPVTVTLGSVSLSMAVLVFEPAPGGARTDPGYALPSLLGQDLLSHFALIVDPQRDRALLLEGAEADALAVP